MNARKHPLTRLLIAASLALGVSIAAHADPMGGPDEGHGDHMQMHGLPGMSGMEHMPPFLHGLNLTEAQRDKIFDLVYAQIPAMREKGKALHKAHAELRQLEMSADYSDAKVKALTESSARTMAEMAQMHASTAHAIFLLLTPEQRKQMEQRKARFESHAMGKDDGRHRMDHD